MKPLLGFIKMSKGEKIILMKKLGGGGGEGQGSARDRSGGMLPQKILGFYTV